MLRTFWNSKSSMIATQEKLDAISNNIANIGTTGYKKVDVQFKDLYMESLDRLGVPLNNNDEIMGTGVKTSPWYRDNSQGFLQETSRPTDFCIDGEGFFKVVTPTGEECYTRDGSFSIDGLGRLVDGRGNKIELKYLNGFSENNVEFTNGNFLVDKEGNVFVKENEIISKVAQIPTYTAVGSDAFISIGSNLYLPNTGVTVEETVDRGIYQGFLEASNVDMGQEFTDMILTQRAFQLGSKGIQTADEMWGMVNNLRSR